MFVSQRLSVAEYSWNCRKFSEKWILVKEMEVNGLIVLGCHLMA
jgi:hypothetical protein